MLRNAYFRTYLFLFGTVATLGVCFWLLASVGEGPSNSDKQDLVLFCAAGFRKPMEKIIRRYEAETGTTVHLQPGGSNTLLSQIQAGGGAGDLYLAAEDYYIERGRELGLVEEAEVVAYQRPVILVAKGNPKSINGVQDLARDDVKVSFGNPEQAAIGRKASGLLKQAGLWSDVEANIRDNGVFKPTVPESANDVAIGAVDAAIVWDALARSYPQLDVVTAPEFDSGRSPLLLSVLSKAPQPAAALKFVRFATASDQGLKIAAESGFEVSDGDPWEERPELTLYAGAVNRKALEPVIQRFEEREGVRINTTYNGCGILTAQMRSIRAGDAAAFPDMFMACDVYYLNEVSDLFGDGLNVSDADIVLVVQPGNPKEIHTVQDLLKPGVRIAVGQPDQCTIGVLTRRLLEAEGVWEEVQEHIATQVASSAQLVPAVVTGSVDAVLAYQTDTLAESDRLQVVSIDSPQAKAVQPYSIANQTRYRRLAASFSGHAAGFARRIRVGGFSLAPGRRRRPQGRGDTVIRPKPALRIVRSVLRSDLVFLTFMAAIGVAFILMILAMLAADAYYLATDDSGPAGNPLVSALRGSEHSALDSADSGVVHGHGRSVAVGGYADRLSVGSHPVSGQGVGRCDPGRAHRPSAACDRHQFVDIVPVRSRVAA